MAYLESIALGFALAAIPGPIFFEVLRRAFTKGFYQGAFLAFGAFTADSLILMAAFFGIQQMLFFEKMQNVLFLIGGRVLLFVGLSGIRINEKSNTHYLEDSKGKKESVLTGFFMSLTNPLGIFVLASVGGAYLIRYTVKITAIANLLLISFGAMMFFMTIAAIGGITSKRVAFNNIATFSKVAGVFLIAYGTYFLYLSLGLFF